MPLFLELKKEGFGPHLLHTEQTPVIVRLGRSSALPLAPLGNQHPDRTERSAFSPPKCMHFISGTARPAQSSGGKRTVCRATPEGMQRAPLQD